MIRQAALDRWRGADGRMHPAEVVIGEEQGKRRFVVLPFLAVPIGQAGEPTNLHLYRSVVPLNVRRADCILIRDSQLRSGDYLKYLWGRVPSSFLRIGSAV